MSVETREWLSTNTLIGFTDKRGTAWHYRAGDANHYPGAVPIEDVRRRLFDWEAEERPIYIEASPAYLPAPSGLLPLEVIPGRKAIVRSDNDAVLGVFSDGYVPHQYDRWLLSSVESILDDTLKIGSAGLLRGGAVAWVQVEMPQNNITREGVEFRPWLNAFGSLDGTFATTYKTGVTNIVCDNTMRAAQRENSPTFRVKSTSRSLAKLAKAREALGIVFEVSAAFEAEVRALCETDFTDRQFAALVEQLTPVDKDAKPQVMSRVIKKRDAFSQLWTSDDRVAPWRGTAWGAYQAINTYDQHEAQLRGIGRVERNQLHSLSGKTDRQDASTLARIMEIAA